MNGFEKGVVVEGLKEKRLAPLVSAAMRWAGSSSAVMRMTRGRAFIAWSAVRTSNPLRPGMRISITASPDRVVFGIGEKARGFGELLRLQTLGREKAPERFQHTPLVIEQANNWWEGHVTGLAGPFFSRRAE